MLTRLNACSDATVKAMWVRLLEYVLNPLDQVEIEAILVQAETDPLIADAFFRVISRLSNWALKRREG